MEISSLFIRVLFLLLPGAIATGLYWKLKGKNTQKDWEDFFVIIIFALLSYYIYALILLALSHLGFQVKTFSQLQPFFDEKSSLDFWEVFYACIISIPLAFIASYLHTDKTINKIGQKLKVTTRFGDEDVWDFFHRSPSVRGNWITVRDHKTNLYYFCWIQSFSDSGKERELLLREVDVFNSENGEHLYKIDVMYISRKQDEITLEASIESDEKKEDEPIQEVELSNESENLKVKNEK
jgi:hypothetical protein